MKEIEALFNEVLENHVKNEDYRNMIRTYLGLAKTTLEIWGQSAFSNDVYELFDKVLIHHIAMAELRDIYRNKLKELI